MYNMMELADHASRALQHDKAFEIWRKGRDMLNTWPAWEDNEERLYGRGIDLVMGCGKPAAEKLELLREVVAEVFNPALPQERRLELAEGCLNPETRQTRFWFSGDKTRAGWPDAEFLFMEGSKHSRAFYKIYDTIALEGTLEPKRANPPSALSTDTPAA